MKQKLQTLLSQGNTKQVIKELLKLTQQQEDLYEETILQSARFEKLSKKKRLGTTSSDEINISLAQINEALLHIINRLENFEETQNKERSWWKYVTGAAVIIGILAGLAEIFWKKFIIIF